MIWASFAESPHESTQITVSLLKPGAIFIASANACDGSKLGLTKPSILLTNWKALIASSSVADVYLALSVSLRKQCSGETPG